MNFFILLALLAGAALPVQAAVNNKLAVYLQNPLLTTLTSFLVGTAGLLVYIFAKGISLQQFALAKNAPPIAWVGGLLGAVYVVSVVNLIPRLGVALTFSLLIAGQMVLTLVLDHFGFLGVPIKEVNVPRVIGVLLIVVGVVIVQRF